MRLLQLLSLVLAQEQTDDIVGGQEVEPFKYSWMTHLVKDSKPWCGGVLLSNDTLLTAGHCSNPSQVNINSVKAFAHRHDLSVYFC